MPSLGLSAPAPTTTHKLERERNRQKESTIIIMKHTQQIMSAEVWDHEQQQTADHLISLQECKQQHGHAFCASPSVFPSMCVKRWLENSSLPLILLTSLICILWSPTLTHTDTHTHTITNDIHPSLGLLSKMLPFTWKLNKCEIRKVTK